LYADGSENDDKVFGYQEYGYDYRYKPTQLTGLMRANVKGTLAS